MPHLFAVMVDEFVPKQSLHDFVDSSMLEGSQRNDELERDDVMIL